MTVETIGFELQPLCVAHTCMLTSADMFEKASALIIISVARTIIFATSMISLFLKSLATTNLDSKLVDRIALNKYMRKLHSLFVVNTELSIASTLAVSALLTFDHTLPRFTRLKTLPVTEPRRKKCIWFCD